MSRAFLLGNGPSLNDVNLSHLSRETTFGCNDIQLLFEQFRPTYWVMEDMLYIKPYLSDINYYTGEKLIYVGARKLTHKGRGTVRYYKHRLWGSIMVSMIKIACDMGFSELYLIGVDHTLAKKTSQDEGKHFSPKYCMKKTEIKSTRRLNKVMEGYKWAKDYTEGKGCKVFNATPKSKLKVFEKVNLEDIL